MSELAEPYMMFIEKATGKEPIISGEYLVEVKPVQTSICDSTVDGTTYEEISTESILNSLDEILNSANLENETPKTIVVTNERGRVVEKKEEELPKTIVFKKVNLFGEDIE